jgi:phytanoyl-CoA hydroxylase
MGLHCRQDLAVSLAKAVPIPCTDAGLEEKRLMELTPEQIAQFRTEGYVAVPNFWNARETAAMQAEVQRLKQDGLLRNVATDGDGKTHSQTAQNLQICPIHPQSTFFRAMPFDDKVVNAVSALIGDPVVLHLDQIFLKPGQHGSGTNWHQDNAYFEIDDPLRGTAMWTAVHDATVSNGTIHVIPGSFRTVYEHTRDPYSDHHIRCYPPEEQAVSVELPAGGVVFFAYGTAHCTRANTTDKERAGMALHFINGAMDGHARGGFAIGKRPFLTGDYADGGESVYGVRVAGTWDKEVERVLMAQH